MPVIANLSEESEDPDPDRADPEVISTLKSRNSQLAVMLRPERIRR